MYAKARPLLLILLLSACEKEPDRKFRVVNDSEIAADFDRNNPVGRYSALPGADGGIYVVDTRKGTVRFCASATSGATPTAFEDVAVACTQPSELSGKQMTPTIRKLE